MDYIFNTLEKLLNIPSPTGNTKEALTFLENEFNLLGIKTKFTTKGALIASIDGKDNSKEVTLSAHIDTLGAMVKEIKPNGRLKITQLGGYSWNTIEGEHVLIQTLENKEYTGTVMTTKSSVHVYGDETNSISRTEENMEVRIDERIENAEDVENLGISVGDFIAFDPRCIITESGFIKSRHLDDKAGVISLLAIAKRLVEENIIPNYKTNFFISHFEEVGHGAAAGIPKNTFEFLAVDMAAPGDGQTSTEYATTICAKDSSGPYDYEFRKKLIKLAEKNNIDYKIDIYPSYGSDGSAALRAGYDFKVALIGPGVDASHSFERTHIDAIVNTIELGYSYLTK